jgi:DNA-binding MarR family transcriptional regulator
MKRKQPDDDDIYTQLQELTYAIRAQIFEAFRDGADGLAPGSWRALLFFARNPGSTPSDVAAHAQRDKAQIARLIKDLVDAGYLKREPDPEDGRSHLLTLSARGRVIEERMSAHRKRLGLRLLAGFSCRERTQLSSLLRRMSHNLARPRK